MKSIEIIERVIKESKSTGVEAKTTCDRLIAGNLEKEVKKVATTFMATLEVIKKAVDDGVDMIITHEPTWYTAKDDVGWLESTLPNCYKEKKQQIAKSGIVIWRFHDYMHRGETDLIYAGYEKELHMNCSSAHKTEIGVYYEIPEVTLETLVNYHKEKLTMNQIQVVGDRKHKIKRLGVLLGGGSLGLGVEEAPMIYANKYQLDCIVCGDVTGWTLPSYAYDTKGSGKKLSLIILGHERSEEMGMKYLTGWLERILKDVDIVFIDAKEPFQYL